MLKNSDRTVRNKGIDGNLYLAVDILEGLKFTARVSGEWKMVIQMISLVPWIQNTVWRAVM